MRSRPWLYPALALAIAALSSCGEETTQPNPAGEQKVAAPELVVAPNSWISRRDMWNTERTDFATAMVPNAAGQSVVYVIGGRGASNVGLTSVMAYNVATNTWTLRAPLPRPLYGIKGGVINGKIYITAGYSYGTPESQLYMYDPATNAWATKSSMPNFGDPGAYFTGGGGAVTGVINGNLYVATECVFPDFGHYYACSPDLLFRYNPVTNRWTTLASPPEAGIAGLGGVIGGKLYLVGSAGGEGRLAAYDPATNRWTGKTGLGRARYGAASVVHAGKLYLIGGTRLNADGTREVLRVNIAYDPATDRWINYAPLPTARTGLAGSRVLLNGLPRIEVIGGSRPGNNLQYIP